MTLYELAFVCYVFSQTDIGEYADFLQETAEHPDLFNPNHRTSLLKFLNRWSCRIANAHHQQVSEEIQDWYGEYVNQLLDYDRPISELTEEELALVSQAHSNLSNRRANPQRRFGATAAAKTLFAIRPKALVAWDNAIREQGQYDSYGDFMHEARDVALDLIEQCNNLHFDISQLPERLGTPHKTVPQLIDEYNWMTITKGFAPPDRDTLQRFLEWRDL